MRVIFNTNIQSENSITDTPFGIIKRKNTPDHIEDWQELGWKEEPSPIYPMLHFVGIEDKSASAVMLAKGIKEYEILDNSKISLTLFRSVGFLGKPDLIRRPGIASGNEFKYIETPDSQLIQKLKFKFAINLSRNIQTDKINQLWKQYAISIPNYQIQEINRFTTTLKYFVMNPLKNQLPVVEKIIDCDDLNGIVVTSILPVDNKSYSIRFLNYNDCIDNGGKVKVKNGITYQWTNMNNKEISEIEILNKEINLGSFKKGEIKTLKINL